MTSSPEKPIIPPATKLIAVETWSNEPPTKEQMLQYHIDHLYEEAKLNRKLIANLVDFVYELPKRIATKEELIENNASLKELVLTTISSINQDNKQYLAKLREKGIE